MSESSMRKFLYRLPRFSTDAAMDLVVGETVVLGRCLNLSESGLQGTFSHPVPVGAEGFVTIYFGEQKFGLRARVSSLRNDQAGLRFILTSDQERARVREFLKLFAPTQSPAG